MMTERSNLNCKPHFGRTSFIREGRCRNHRRSAIFAAKNRCKGKLASQRPTTSHRLFRRDQANGEMHMSPIAAIAFETKDLETPGAWRLAVSQTTTTGEIVTVNPNTVGYLLRGISRTNNAIE